MPIRLKDPTGGVKFPADLYQGIIGNLGYNADHPIDEKTEKPIDKTVQPIAKMPFAGRPG
jgi:hypothetical protein